MDAAIPVWIKNTFQPGEAGTKITAAPSERVSPVRAVSSLAPVAMITLVTRPDVHFADIFGRLYLRLAHDHVDVPFTTQSSSENALGLALREQDLERVLHSIQRHFRTELSHGVLRPPRVERDLAVVAVLGQQMKGVPGVLARVFGAVARCGVSVVAVAQGASEMNICFAVPAAQAPQVVAAVHDEFMGAATNEVLAGHSAEQTEASLLS
jgi:aspartokinase/homoserine dehydrogenase 1